MSKEIVNVFGGKLEDVANSSLYRWLNEPAQVEQIGDRLYMRFPNAGIGFDADLDGRVATVFFYSEGYKGYKGFSRALPEGISFTDNRRAIRDRLGEPAASGGGVMIQLFGKAPNWDRFDRSSYVLHVQYDDDDRGVKLVSLMRPDSVPK